MKRLLCLSLLLCACGIQPAPTVVTITPASVRCIANTDAEIVRCADGLTATAFAQTATAVSMATGNALATQTRHGIEQATGDAVEYQNTAIALALSGDQATNAKLAADLANTQLYEQATQAAQAATTTAHDGTVTAQAQAAADARATEIKLAETNNGYQWQETTRQTINAVILAALVVVVLIAVLAYFFIRAFIDFRARQLEKDADQDRAQRKAEHEQRMLKLELEALASSMRESNAGTTVFLRDGRVLTLPRAVGPVENPTFISDVPSATPIESVIINAGADSHSVPKWTRQEQEAVEAMASLIQAAIDYHAAKRNTGEKARQIPRFSHLGWSPNKWVEVRKLFGPALASGPGAANGTYPANEKQSLGELLQAVRLGRVYPVFETESTPPLPADGEGDSVLSDNNENKQ